MENKKEFAGVIIPMVTPLTGGGEIDKAAVGRIIDHLCEGGVAGVFVLGTTGEAASIAGPQKIELATLAVECTNGRAKVYAGVSDNCISHTVEAAESYFELGVDAVVAHVPCYYSIDQEEIRRYFIRVADSIDGPLLLYNIPKTTHHSLSIETIDSLSHHPKIVGLKDSENDPARMESILQMVAGKNGFSYVCGCAPLSFQALSLGADGIVPSTGNIVPEMYQQLYERVVGGDQSVGQELQEQTNRISNIYQQDRTLGQSLAALKMMMSILGLCGPTMMPPLQAMKEQQQMQLREQMEGFNLC